MGGDPTEAVCAVNYDIFGEDGPEPLDEEVEIDEDEYNEDELEPEPEHETRREPDDEDPYGTYDGLPDEVGADL